MHRAASLRNLCAIAILGAFLSATPARYGTAASTPEPGAPPAPTDSGRAFVAVTSLFPGGGHPPPEDPRAKLYDSNAQAIAEGKRMFEWYNCSGCHFHGGGGMGPALMDPEWRYGGRIDQIHESILQGRPNGMPAWGGKIPDDQLWEIAAYVHSLSEPSSATGGPGEAMPESPPPPEATPETGEISPK